MELTSNQGLAVLSWQGYEFIDRLPDACVVRVYGRRHQWHDWRRDPREAASGQRYVFLMVWS